MAMGSRLRRLDACVLGVSLEGESELEWLARLSRLRGGSYSVFAALARQVISLNARVEELERASGGTTSEAAPTHEC